MLMPETARYRNAQSTKQRGRMLLFRCRRHRPRPAQKLTLTLGRIDTWCKMESTWLAAVLTKEVARSTRNKEDIIPTRRAGRHL
jgi:hypothetical protein